MAVKNWPAPCFALTEQWEGWHQFSNDPVDPGGATWCGLTQREYDEWRRLQGLPLRGVHGASDVEIMAIFKTQYWDKVRGDELPSGLDYLLYDIAINMGPGKAIRFLQQAVGATVDGVFGLETLGAIRGKDVKRLIQVIAEKRMSFWHSLTTWWRFGKGWASRGVGAEKQALAMT